MDEIINAHSHLIDMPGMLKKFGNVTLPSGISVLEELESTLEMLNPEVLISQMDEAGISRAVLFAVEAPIVYASNEYVSGLCERWPDRFIGFASVNPLDSKAPGELRRAVKELGLRGLKLHPPLQQFSPDDETVFPIYDAATELNIPVVFHVGTTPFGPLCRLRHANPLLIDEVAVRYPDLRIMLTHLGTLWHNEAFMVVEKNPNVFIDTAAYIYELPQLLTKDTITRVGADRFVFGTDYPMPYTDRPHRMKDFVDAIRALKLSPVTERQFFRENFVRLLEGKSGPKEPGIGLQDLIHKAATMTRKA